MSESKLIEKDLGPETKLKVEWKNGSLMIMIDYGGKLGGAGAYVVADALQTIDAITDAIPGEMDDVVIDGIAKKFLDKKK